MNNILGFLLASGVTITASLSSAYAADSASSHSRLARLTEELALSEVQVAALLPIFQSNHAQRYTCLTTAEWKSCMKTVIAQTDTLIEAQLTTGQKELFQIIKKNGPKPGQGPKGQPGQNNHSPSDQDEDNENGNSNGYGNSSNKNSPIRSRGPRR